MLADSRVLRVILRQIAQESDFLLEVKLMELLKPYIIEDQRNIIAVDNVFVVSNQIPNSKCFEEICM